MLTENTARTRDVFICFSKSRPGEAKVAFALKDVLEQHGLFAFEYEDWSWVNSGVGREADVDRAKLHQMLTTCSVVVLISPHEGETTAGVQTELAELRSCGSPVILLHWSPSGWHPLLEPDRFDGLNIVWYHEGSSTSDHDVADNQCEFIARQLGAGSWLACQIHRLKAEHATTAGTLLAHLPEDSEHPLLNLRLLPFAGDPTQSEEAIDLPVLAAEVAAVAEPEAIRGFVKFWRSGTDLMAALMADKAQFSLIRPMRLLVTGCESLCHAGEKRLGSYELSWAELKDQGIALIRVDRSDEAIMVLKRALKSVPEKQRHLVFQALALAQQKVDPQAAIQSLTSAIKCSPQLEIESVLTYDRGVHRTEAGEHAAALDDFSLVVDKCTEPPIRQSALRARARVQTKLQNYDAAIDDYTQVLADTKSAPRMAVSSWMDRAALYKLQQRNAEAIEDLTRAIAAADADQLQRFRALEARAELFEGSGQALAAASDYEAMAGYRNASREYQLELRQKAAHLRGANPQ
jgi:tetratricopeptide (TPR) repeat protein